MLVREPATNPHRQHGRTCGRASGGAGQQARDHPIPQRPTAGMQAAATKPRAATRIYLHTSLLPNLHPLLPGPPIRPPTRRHVPRRPPPSDGPMPCRSLRVTTRAWAAWCRPAAARQRATTQLTRAWASRATLGPRPRRRRRHRPGPHARLLLAAYAAAAGGALSAGCLWASKAARACNSKGACSARPPTADALFGPELLSSSLQRYGAAAARLAMPIHPSRCVHR